MEKEQQLIIHNLVYWLQSLQQHLSKQVGVTLIQSKMRTLVFSISNSLTQRKFFHFANVSILVAQVTCIMLLGNLQISMKMEAQSIMMEERL